MLVGIFFAATGRGGELAYEHADHAPLDLGPVSAADIALLRPPTAMWGYNMQVTDEALDSIARAMRERDVTIAYLQEQLATLARNGSYVEPQGRARPPGPREPLAPEIPSFPEASQISAGRRHPGGSRDPGATSGLDETQDLDDPGVSRALEFPQIPEAADAAEAPEALESPQAPDVADIAESPQVPATPTPRRFPDGRRRGVSQAR